ncbi:urease accessory protein UreD [Paenibacillus sp. HB172176]|uniref:urease accessory protein UreD n=1 Tax=Paenibacillus sp. HB172176 TaxID=2493690 RepID=UPI0014387BE2|nr:urease accessory protein UreD [Paenibacillus sp. HB172176]
MGNSQQHAYLRSVFVKSGDRTVLANKFHTAPLKIAKSFQKQGQLSVIVMDVSPGILEGDRYTMEWRAESETHAMITNQSYMKAHPCPRGILSKVEQSFQLEAGAVVEHMPEPVMLFEEAVLLNEVKVTLEEGSIWMQADILCPGRTHKGEQFRYRSFDNRLSVQWKNELIFHQRQFIDPMRHRLRSSGSWEEMTYTGTFYLFSDFVRAEHLPPFTELLERYAAPEEHPISAGATLTHRHGIAVMAVCTAAWPLQQLMRLIWEEARKLMLGKAPLRLLQC